MSWLQLLCSEVALLERRKSKRSAIMRRKRGFNYYPDHATSLYYAASFGIEHVVLSLLEQGAEVDAAGGRLGATAFHAAAMRGHVNVMDILLQKGADPNKADFMKMTALHSAATHDELEAIKYLLDHDADPNMRDDRNETPYDWAYAFGYVKAQNFLKGVTSLEDEAPEAESMS